jgi:two-component system NtrC family sensor kinase
MALPKRVRIGLAAKLAILLVASTAAFFLLYGYLNLRDLRRISEAQVVQAAERITDVIRRSTHYEMLHNDREALYNVIQEIGSEPGIRRIRIFNKEGRIQFSTDPAEVGRVVDKHAEACYGCHARQEPLRKLERPDRARSFTDAGGNHLLGVIRPIENAPACSSAACHSHPAEQQVLGVIDANLSLAGVDAEGAGQQRHLVVVTILAVILVSLVSGLYIWLVVHKPVRELMIGTRRVAGGDLQYRLPVRSDDELGELAAEFNRMTADLAAAHQEITGWAKTLEERVERKTLELETAHKTLLAHEKMASIGKLAATVAHEVNNPLFGVLTYARLTSRKLAGCGIPDQDKREMVDQLEIIQRESQRCGDIMRNLLTFARQAPSHREPNDVNVLIGRAVVLVKHKLDLQQIGLAQNLAPQLPAVSCDAGQIQQVVLILAVNAAEAMRNGGRLEIATRLADGMVEIRIRDDGPGIDPENLSRIFEPFFTTKEDQLRTGLGLAVAKSIVEQHGGEIVVQSTKGEGTEFVVALPVGQVEPAVAVSTGGAGEITSWQRRQS